MRNKGKVSNGKREVLERLSGQLGSMYLRAFKNRLGEHC